MSRAARLEDRVVVVTGASRGIGLAIARHCVSEGARVVLTSRHEEDLARVRDTFASPERVVPVVAHAGSWEQASHVMEVALEAFGAIDGLVNNAATNPYFGPLVEADEARLRKAYEVNQAGVVAATAAAWRAWLRDHGGAVVNIASIGGSSVEPGLGWYNATKAAVLQLTRQLAYELAPGVRVNAVAPGLIRTQFARAIWEPAEQLMAERIPLGRIGEPSDVAAAVAMLLSDEASWITGATLTVDGGTLVRPSGGVG